MSHFHSPDVATTTALKCNKQGWKTDLKN